jgi:hypothetical protein
MRFILTWVMMGGCLATAAEPSVKAPPPEAPAEEKRKLKRPTTKEEFAALAKEGPLPPWLPTNGPGGVMEKLLDATVVSVTDQAIEVEVAGRKGSTTYPAHELLVSGGLCHWESDSHCYLLDDVKKGDEVLMGVGTVDKKRGEECFYVSIRRRPGGEVPESRKPSKVNPYHLSRQREVEYEDRGEYTPERLAAYEMVRAFRESKGLPPPPPLPKLEPRVKPEEKPKK